MLLHYQLSEWESGVSNVVGVEISNTLTLEYVNLTSTQDVCER